MARGFRYFGKKRGHRRTGSPVWGIVGEAAFFAAMLLLGCAGLVQMVSKELVPEWRVNHEFIETTCKVLEKSIGEKSFGEDGTLYRPEIRIEYQAAGTICRDWHYDIRRAYSTGRENAQAVLDRFALYDSAKNNRYPCWYDPQNPSVCVLTRGHRWWIWLLFTVPLSFIAIGAGGLIYAAMHWGRSAERRAAMARRIAERAALRAGRSGGRQYPSVPRGADMTNSPGTQLKFRLPMANSPGWALAGTLAFCVGWNGAVVLAAILIGSHLNERPGWLATLLCVPFVLIGLGSIVVFLRQLLKTAGIGPTLVEISDHPIDPGRCYRAVVSQSGRLKVKSLRVSLVCVETATYRQGTNTRTESQEVYRQELFCRDDFRIQSGMPFEADIAWDVPRNAMHSFASDHNEIGWTLVVEEELAGWPGFRRAFPVIVRPNVGDFSA